MTTVAITNYASLSTAINDFPERTYDQGEIDRFIGLAEGDFRLYFGPSFAKETSSLMLAFTAGSATQPSGFIRPTGLTHTTYGALTEKSMADIRARRVSDTSGVPDWFAVTGTTIEVAPSYTGNLILDYEGSLTGLSGSNAANWLITNAPQVYLDMCLAVEAEFRSDFATASGYRSSALGRMPDIAMQSIVAQHGRSSVTIPGATP